MIHRRVLMSDMPLGSEKKFILSLIDCMQLVQLIALKPKRKTEHDFNQYSKTKYKRRYF